MCQPMWLATRTSHRPSPSLPPSLTSEAFPTSESYRGDLRRPAYSPMIVLYGCNIGRNSYGRRNGERANGPFCGNELVREIAIKSMTRPRPCGLGKYSLAQQTQHGGGTEGDLGRAVFSGLQATDARDRAGHDRLANQPAEPRPGQASA